MSILHDSAISIAPGSVVIVRDEEWLVTGVEHTTDGRLLRCQGLSELVRDTTASFYEGLDADRALLDQIASAVGKTIDDVDLTGAAEADTDEPDDTDDV